ncbi:putative quinol monooxygenase [Burkholderia cenocepacia]|uniref:Antibiotic biosynthesis monooxygenase n=1 Tax=Burkholderia cenocepacia TaxID=95486 RepID=A0ABD4UKQ8_9BURK|nr:putative quinol monooxygenase [Burkholderia cenocepacia]MCW3698936.1 antibiotic biosynthesis monooxygenase [Burkholderia cenocepacia]MCW3706554.1 antibiotic biosynthesis monooxygenase [Burkholderia cenocepacia]MCW3714955.1 antibiotic biosynthesis monooxygenase [Burkholderia cenocepacia]MCW3722729.1 antibiotic biosynthesis monooxygenase [Burkholderia cenocepacia]MCW3729783.1 antibiotic biosynthesis monooxygenase [Burkholderia cenocepacia]
MTQLHIVAVLYAKAGHEARLRTRLAELVEPSRQEHGNLRYELLVDEADARRFVFVELWENAQVQATHHNESPHIAAFQARDWDAVDRVEVYRLSQIA